MYDEPWPYEKLCIVVDDDGIVSIDWDSCQSTLDELIAEDCALLDFEEIMDIAAEQFAIGNIDLAEFNYNGLINMDLRIDEIKLGYMRVELSDGSGRYVLVPVWDFFGNYNAKLDNGKGGEYEKQDRNYRYSYLTINAIDGTVIDRSLGY